MSGSWQAVCPVCGGALRGPWQASICGICNTPGGEVWYCSLAGSFIAQVDLKNGASRMVEPPTPQQGARRAWSDSQQRIWVSDWGANRLLRFDPGSERFEAWRHPRESAHVQQIPGRPGEVRLPESGTEHIAVMRCG